MYLTVLVPTSLTCLGCIMFLMLVMLSSIRTSFDMTYFSTKRIQVTKLAFLFLCVSRICTYAKWLIGRVEHYEERALRAARWVDKVMAACSNM